MNKLILSAILIMFGISSYSQTDTIYYSNDDLDNKFEQIKQELNQNIEQYKNLTLSINSEIDQKLLAKDKLILKFVLETRSGKLVSQDVLFKIN